MVKYRVTEELSLLIKTLRTKQKQSSKKLSAAIQKSDSYISKLESNAIKTIPEAELTAILSEITPGEDFYRDKLPLIAKTLLLSISKERIPEQLWLINYDLVKRPVDIPEQLVEEISRRLAAAGAEPETLTHEINSNAEIPAGEIGGYPFNQWVETASAKHPVMRVSLDEESVRGILSGSVKKAGFTVIYSIAFTSLKLQNYGAGTSLAVPKATRLMQETRDFLSGYRCYSLIDMNRIFLNAQPMEEQKQLLSAFNRDQTAIINQIIVEFQQIMEQDPETAVQALCALLQNLQWNSGFMCKLVGLPFYELGEMSYQMNKRLLRLISDSLDQYREIPAFQKRFETY